MPVKRDAYNGVCVLAVDGDLVAETCLQLRRMVDERVDQRKAFDFVVDFEKAQFIDSAGLETLLWLKRRSDDGLGQVKLTGLDENCRKILEMTRLAPRFECDEDLPTALKTMR